MMKTPFRFFFRLFFPILLLLTGAFADEVVKICPSCSWEVTQDALFCAHCGAGLRSGTPSPAHPASAVSKPAGTPAPVPESPLASAVLQVQKADAAIAKMQDAPNPVRELWAIRNSLAVLPLAPGTVSPETRKALTQRETELFASIALSPAPCPECHATGIVSVKKATPLTLRNSGKEIQTLESVSVRELNKVSPDGTERRRCAFCHGQKELPCVADRKRLLGHLRLGRREYERAVQFESNARRDVCGIFLPVSANALLSLENRAVLARGNVEKSACENCAGTGTVPCGDCDGFGLTACDNRSFHTATRNRNTQGSGGRDIKRIEEELLPHQGKQNLCPGCKSTSEMPGSVRCRNCLGKGVSVCKKCNGSTRKDDCRKCSGNGIDDCRICRGTGVDRRSGAPCRGCSGEKQTLCSSCGGSGYGR